MRTIALPEIERALAAVDPLPAIEAGFVAFSQGRAVLPPVGELTFAEPPGEVHIKYGYLRGGEHYVIKVASGFYRNPERGLPSSDGLMLLFRQATGEPLALLQDRGRLTDLRTAVAGAVAAKHLAPSRVEAIGVLGSGIQAREQLRQLKGITPCRRVVAWGRNRGRLEAHRDEMESEGFEVALAETPAEVAARANLIVTATPATEPLLHADEIRPGTHLTAVGSDTPAKRELDVAILRRADRVVVDSVDQVMLRGESHHALAAGVIAREDLVELGAVIAGSAPGRTSDDQVTVADLTGLAVQDLQIATAVLQAIESTESSESSDDL